MENRTFTNTPSEHIYKEITLFLKANIKIIARKETVINIELLTKEKVKKCLSITRLGWEDLQNPGNIFF